MVNIVIAGVKIFSHHDPTFYNTNHRKSIAGTTKKKAHNSYFNKKFNRSKQVFLPVFCRITPVTFDLCKKKVDFHFKLFTKKNSHEKKITGSRRSFMDFRPFYLSCVYFILLIETYVNRDAARGDENAANVIIAARPSLFSIKREKIGHKDAKTQRKKKFLFGSGTAGLWNMGCILSLTHLLYQRRSKCYSTRFDRRLFFLINIFIGFFQTSIMAGVPYDKPSHTPHTRLFFSSSSFLRAFASSRLF